MSSIILPHRWRQQPQGPVAFDRSHPLMGGFLAGENGPFLLDAPTPTRRSFGVRNSLAGRGLNPVVSTWAGEQWTSGFPTPGTNSYTIWALVVARVVTGTQSILDSDDIVGTDRTFQFRLEPTTGAFTIITFFTTGGATSTTGSAVALGVPTLLSATVQATSHAGYQNGIKTISATGLTTRRTWATNKFSVGQTYNAANAQTASGVDILAWGVSSSAFPDSWHAALAENPWQVLRPLQRRIWVDAGAAGLTASLTVTEANDTLSATSTAALAASLTVTEANDTLSAASTAALVVNLAVTEVNDTLSAASTAALVASLTATEADDTLSSDVASGAGRTASLDITEANDALSSASTAALVAILAVTEAEDTSVETAAPPVEEPESILDPKFQGNVRFRPLRNPRTAAMQVVEEGDICISAAAVNPVLARGVGLRPIAPPAAPVLRKPAPAPTKPVPAAAPPPPVAETVVQPPVAAPPPLALAPTGPSMGELALGLAAVVSAVGEVSGTVAEAMQALAKQNAELQTQLRDLQDEISVLRRAQSRQDLAAENKRRADAIARRLSSQ